MKYLKNIKKEETPLITFEDLPKVVFDDPILNETVTLPKERLKDYGEQLDILSETEKAAKRNGWENTLAYFAPFLICIAIALRITKVTGELRHET